MSEEKAKHSAVSSTKAIVYQLCIAVQKCYEMVEEQAVLIEELGDVTTEGYSQIEVKQYNDSLTDGHPNLWKTLQNWIRDDFDISSYNALILHTTQQFGKNATIKQWNDSTSSRRLEILEKIHDENEIGYQDKIKKQSATKDDLIPIPQPPVPEVLKYQRYIFEKLHEDKLKEIVSKFFIEASSPTLSKLYIEIQQKYIKGILNTKRPDFLNALIGFIAQPQSEGEKHWRITYKEFDDKIGELQALYNRETRIFPTKYFDSGYIPRQDQTKNKNQYLFIKKIEDIEHHEALEDAFNDYIRTIETINDEFKKYCVSIARTESYKKQLMRLFGGMHRKHARNCSNIIKDSQDFYDTVTTEPPPVFSGFDAIPSEFRNGILHVEMNDASKNFKWRLN